MSYKNPPIDKRFPVNRPYAPNKGKKGIQLKTILKKLLTGEMPAKDPKTKELLISLGLKPNIASWLMLRLCLNGTEGETKAICEIMDRVDGKVPTPIQTIDTDERLLEEEIEFTGLPKDSDGNGRFKRFYN